MVTTLTLDNIELDVIYKDIKNVHLSVHPPTGRVRISVPRDASHDVVRAFAVSKIGWIRRQQRHLQEQEREPPREYLERESHYLWGKRYLLSVEEHDAPPTVEADHHRLVVRVRRGSDSGKREATMAKWYREEVRTAATPLIRAWEKILGVRLAHFYVRSMKTMWGSCTPASSTIRLNTELAKKPIECLEYIIVHELTHLREPHHGAKFVEIMDAAMPTWRSRRDQLNDLPVRHEEWRY